jgi:hypothetical protein
MYDYFDRTNGYGTPGIILTIFAYIVLTFINLTLMYYYLIFIHMGGRVIDIYQRLSGNVQHFFLPHDSEVSLNYLKWVCAKALRFNHRVTNFQEEVIDEKGKKQKVHFVHVYKFDKNTHDLYSYRSFIRDYDGAIKEMNIKKTVLNEEMKDGITGNLPHRPDRQRYVREEYSNWTSEEKEPEEEELKAGSGDDSPLKKSMDSKLLLRDDIHSHRGSGNEDNDDNLISNQMESHGVRDDEEESDEEKRNSDEED